MGSEKCERPMSSCWCWQNSKRRRGRKRRSERADAVGPRSLFVMAKSRWEIENQGFNEGKSRHGLEHICHRHANSLLITRLLACLALTIKRLYRLRYVHRGSHPWRSSAELVLALWINLFRPCSADTS